jgi:peptidoglycan biosynthesis protein MviN/MurJ (putative lipid II flippase)
LLNTNKNYSNYHLIIAFCTACFTILVFYSNFFKNSLSVLLILKSGFKVQDEEKVSSKLIIGAFLMQFLLLIPRFLDRGIAANEGAGGIATLEYAYNIYTAAGIMIGTSAIIVHAQKMSAIFSGHKPIYTVMKLVLPVTIVSTVVTFLIFNLSSSLVSNIYFRGAFTASDVKATSEYLMYLMLSFTPMVANMIVFQILLGGQKILLIAIPTFVKILTKFLVLHFAKNFPHEIAIGASNAASELAFFVTGVIIVYMHVKKNRNN